jgi:signal transduction histidine kinase
MSRGRVTRRDANGRAVRMTGINLDVTERKRTDAALREQSERLQLGQAAARVLIMDWDIPSDRLVWSGSPEWLRGPLPTSGEYPLFKEQVHPEDRERFLAARDRAIASLQGGSHEYRVVRTDGEVIWAQSREKVVADASGRAVRVLAAVLDITERKRAEVALAASEARAQDFARASGEWFWETDAGHRFTWFSESVANAVGVPAGWHLGKRRDELAAESSDFTAEPWKSHLEALRRHEPFRNFRYLRQGPQGARWLSVSGIPLFGGGGEFLGYRGVASDVTQLVEMERRARESDERLRHTLENFDEFICLTDTQDRIVFANRRFRQNAADCAEYAEPGRDYGDFLRARAARGHYLDAGGREEQWVRERLAQRRKGGGPREQRQHDGVVMLVFDQCFADGSVMTYGLDVTKRLRMEAELRKLNQELESRVAERTTTLEAALRDLEAFSYSVSHDLRSSLGVISNFAHLIRLDEAPRLSDEGRRHLGIVEGNAQKLGRLVDDLLALAKVGGGSLRDEPLDLHEIASAEARELTGAYPRTELRIGRLPAARGDPTLVRQIFANLLGNAFKYSSLTAAPCVEVGWSEPERACYVRDNGVGFDPSRTDKLFGAFERLHADSEFEGQGIGLAVVKRAIERHGGSVWAQGRPGEGATVYFRLQPAA